jgi:hypothetical protein
MSANVIREQDLLRRPAAVEDALQETAPCAVLVDLVEDPERAGRQLAAQNAVPMLWNILAQVTALRPG